ncbi:hypothetical protein LPTSP4_21020 [Leptospira ryugenii]|uniref:Uncharacterized protein n=1 Tax=Leptospira ryugenii TaxID=1917863 RepID=A0A2P2E199_9LEPT|nr:hypothetical protein [Leptospira ryugenii]GBF50576.1 hypothetical protein LPTSP4_21020 [Leptospira ryugenii]
MWKRFPTFSKNSKIILLFLFSYSSPYLSQSIIQLPTDDAYEDERTNISPLPKKNIEKKIQFYDLYEPKEKTEREVLKQAIEYSESHLLYREAHWENLLFWKKSWIWSSYSLIENEGYFLSKDGFSKPRLEMMASLRAGFLPASLQDEHPICRFPERYTWFKNHIPNLSFPKVQCVRFLNWKERANFLQFQYIYLEPNFAEFDHIVGDFFLSVTSEKEKGEIPKENPGEPKESLYLRHVFTSPQREKDIPKQSFATSMFIYPLTLQEGEKDRLIRILWDLNGVERLSVWHSQSNALFHLYLMELVRKGTQFGPIQLPIDSLKQINKKELLLTGREERTTNTKQRTDENQPSILSENPIDMHGKYRAKLSYGSSNLGSFSEISFRFGLHDLLNSKKAYPKDSELQILNLDLRRYADGRAELSAFQVLRYVNVRPFSLKDRNFSEAFQLGTESIYFRDSSRRISVGNADYLLGLSFGKEVPDSFYLGKISMLAGGKVQSHPEFRHGLRYGPQAGILYIWELGSFKLLVQSFYTYARVSKNEDHFENSLQFRYAISEALEIRAEAKSNIAYQENLFSIHYLF